MYPLSVTYPFICFTPFTFSFSDFILALMVSNKNDCIKRIRKRLQFAAFLLILLYGSKHNEILRSEVCKMKPIKEGKVREIYDNGDSLIMVATDRISCFDVILNNTITKKGTVLTQMSKFWFDMTKDILPNHMISTDVKDMPEFFQQPQFDGNSMMCKKLNMLPIECIVRGYITGSGWASYQKNGTVCGIKLPEGLVESDKLPEPIYTPSTKAEIGEHDENISYEQSIAHLEKYFPGKGEEYAAKLRDYTIALYKKCADYALTRGIIIADTKFEFGLDEDGNIVIGDEMLTPDSSRFWPADGYEPGHGQPSFDKQFARDWLKANPDNNWTLPEDVVQKTIDIYLQGYEMLTGKTL
ncbi:phosphoribosylaminoimidazolesuccinocarboxamide synthase [Sellimonas catena]